MTSNTFADARGLRPMTELTICAILKKKGRHPQIEPEENTQNLIKSQSLHDANPQKKINDLFISLKPIQMRFAK